MKRLFKGEAYRPTGYGITICVIRALIFYRYKKSLNRLFSLRNISPNSSTDSLENKGLAFPSSGDDRK
ncbi:MAG: hypothetical protein LBJ00_18065 [Planctomycetaceae bacterium]|nr:hypothetical protein [Planctomycetaceae bacterium]